VTGKVSFPARVRFNSDPRAHLFYYSIDTEGAFLIGKADGMWCKQFNSTSVECGYISTS